MLGTILMPVQVRRVKTRLLALLRAHEVDDSITVRIKETTDHHWLAQYRSKSQFGRGPIFWVSPKHPAHDDELLTTLAHEYGHVIAEYVRYRLPKLHDERVTSYPDEEDFAEDFAQMLARGKPNVWMQKFFTRFVTYLSTGES